ncbi:hypothetical protein C8Q79DRAFT_897161, partial [Trametes meyenii]
KSIYTNAFCLTPLALLYYDFVLTIPQEIERYWKGSFSWTTLLFFLNRYLSVVMHLPVIVEFFGDLSGPVSFSEATLFDCRQVRMYHHIISIVIQGIVAALLIIRTYALYGRDRRVLVLLLIIIGVGGAVGTWAITAGPGVHRTANMHSEVVADHIGCDTTLSQQQGYNLALTWGSMLIFDATVFVLTILQAFKAGRAWRGGYIHVMLRDGNTLNMSSSVLFAFYLTTILTLAVSTISPTYRGFTISLTNVVSATLVTRLMLNIRDPNLSKSSCHLQMADSDA